MGTTSVATLERLHHVAPLTEVVAMLPRQHVRSVDPLWRVWPGRDWPASADEESALIANLQIRANLNGPSDAIEPRRGDITAMLNALRCGLDASDLLARAPGLRPDRLIVAHAALEARRRGAVSAWRAIASAPTPECLATWGDEAAALVPVMIGRLREVRVADRAELETVVAACAADVDRVGRLAASVEQDMSDSAIPSRRRTGLAELLFSSTGSGLWHHECYLAQRVGSLVPVRVAALLGEHAAR